MLRNARLRSVFTLRRARKGAFFADGNDGADLAEGDITHRNPVSENLMTKPRLYYFFHPRHPLIIPAN
jgi:hypothetical protein